MLSVLADRDQTTGQCSNRRVALTKSRVGEEGWISSFELRFVELGIDEGGEPFGACYVEPAPPGNITTLVSKTKDKNPPRGVKVYLKAFDILIGEKSRKVCPFGSEGPEVIAVNREDIREEFYRLWAADGDSEEARAAARRKAFKRAEDWAHERYLIASYDIDQVHMVWRLKKDDR